MIVRMLRSGYIGPIADLAPPEIAIGHATEGEGYAERPVLLVYDGEFESMDGPVTILPKHVHRLVKGFNSLKARAMRLTGLELIPLNMCPPMQMDHRVTSEFTVGRVVGPCWAAEIEVEDEDGTKRMAVGAFAWTRILGRENVERVNDGRWIHVSIGADLNKGQLNELSFTPFPAAPNASLLSRVRAAAKPVTEESPVANDENKNPFPPKKNADKPEGEKPPVKAEGAEPVEDVVETAPGTTTTTTKITIEESSNAPPPAAAEPPIVTPDMAAPKPGEDAVAPKPGEPVGAAAGEPLAPGGEAKGPSMSYKDMKARLAVIDQIRQQMTTQNPGQTPEQIEESIQAMTAEEIDAMASNLTGAPAAAPAAEPVADAPAEKVEKTSDGNAEPSDEENKKKESRMTKLTALKASTEKLSGKLKLVRLAEKKAKLGARLSSFRASGKVTPAEIKKMDLDELAGKSDETIEALMVSLSQRQPVIDPSIYGTVAAQEISEVAKNIRFAQKEAEVMARSSVHASKKKGKGKDANTRLSEIGDEEALAASVRQQVAQENVQKSSGTVSLGDLQVIHRCMEDGDMEGAKTKLSEYMARCQGGAGGQPMQAEHIPQVDGEAHLSALAEQIKPLEDLICEQAQMIAELQD